MSWRISVTNCLFWETHKGGSKEMQPKKSHKLKKHFTKSFITTEGKLKLLTEPKIYGKCATLPQENCHSWISGDARKRMKHTLFRKEVKPHANRKSHDLICSEYLLYKLHWNSIFVPTWTWFPWAEPKLWHEFMLWHLGGKWNTRNSN